MLCTHSILQVTMKRTLKQKKSFRIHVGSTLYMIEEKRWSAAVNWHKIIIVLFVSKIDFPPPPSAFSP